MELCIDVGNCFTKACFISGNKFINVKDPTTNEALLPTCIHINPKNQVAVGQQAEDAFLHYLDLQRFKRFKRNLDKQFNNAYLLDLSLGDQMYWMLRLVKAFAEEQFNQVSDTAILTVPDFYKNTQSDSMKRAANKAGFRSVKLLTNSLAAIYYAEWLSPTSERMPLNQATLVYQLGGTFEASLVWYNGFSYRSQPLYDPPSCGGWKFDDLLLEDIKAQSSPYLRSILDTNNKSKEALRTRFHVRKDYQNLKHRLSENPEASMVITVDADVPSETCSYTLTRERFNKLIEPGVQESITRCDSLLRAVNLRWEHLHRVLLVGGSSQIPYVKQAWQNLLNNRVVVMNNPLLGTCAGGAIYGETALHCS